MATPSRIRALLALFLLAGSSIFGCGSEPPPAPAAPAAASPAVDTGPPSGAAADAARAKSPRK
ncbi:hypothetical protein [Singulisphaera acidiphila]|uniref:hypothetical protein n=1 Tax=Singulisphaera acidiphila TaxID=466153 RepID=UPI0012FBDB79|nr:hypothetical protein [Singulisphaera acidiphila]